MTHIEMQASWLGLQLKVWTFSDGFVRQEIVDFLFNYVKLMFLVCEHNFLWTVERSYIMNYKQRATSHLHALAPHNREIINYV